MRLVKLMAKKSKGTMIGAIGGVMIGAAILLFVVTLVLNNLKAAGDPGGAGTTDATRAARNASWADLNSTIDQIQTMLNVVVILLAVSGIVLIGTQIIALVGG